MLDDPRSADPRDDDRAARDIDVQWVSLDHDPSDAHDVDASDRDPGERDRDRDSRDHDPREVFAHDLDLPPSDERELVLDRDHEYELDGESTRTLAATGAFRIIAERDLPSNDARKAVRDLRDQGLVRNVSIHGRERGVNADGPRPPPPRAPPPRTERSLRP